MPENRTPPVIPFLLCQTVCFSAGFIGSQATIRALQGWYPTLSKPSFTPPGWLFAPVWTVLYFLMGLALFQVWRSEPSRARTWGLWLFAFQLLLNGLWSWIFFGWYKLQLAFFEIVILDFVVLATILVFRRIKGSSAGLLIPYLAWLCFATALNFSIWRMNEVGARPQDGDIQIKIEDPESGPLLPQGG
jgi:benzodiazapine receptor